MARITELVNIIAPVLLAIIIGVAYQLGYITYIKHPEEVDLTNTLGTLEKRLKELESEIVNIGNNQDTALSIHDLETRLDDVQKILEAVKHDTKEEIEKLTNGEVKTERHLYVTERDKAIFLMLGGLSVLQIGLVTSIYFLFRKLKHQSTESTVRGDNSNKSNDDISGTVTPVKTDVNNGQIIKKTVVVNDT